MRRAVGDRVLLNVDCGELPEEDDELLGLADLLHIACGGHAGDEGSMRRAMRRALGHGARIGAHPSHVDREGFGRRALDVAPATLRRQVRAQCEALRAIAEPQGAAITHVKLHGALYPAATSDGAVAAATSDGAIEALGQVTLVGAPGGELEVWASRQGLPFLAEGFADRRTGPDGRLLPRAAPGAVVGDPGEARDIVRALRGRVDTICVHADTPRALEIARAVREELCAPSAR